MNADAKLKNAVSAAAAKSIFAAAAINRKIDNFRFCGSKTQNR
jgi:hypothetical protein